MHKILFLVYLHKISVCLTTFRNILISIVFIAIAIYGHSQEFQKGNYDISIATGIGVYAVTTNDTNEIEQNNGINAAQLLFPATANYFITDRWAAGISIQYNKVLTDLDTNNVFARTVNFGINNKIVILNRPDDNVYFDLCMGHSKLQWQNRRQVSRLTGTGLYYNLGMGINHYFNNNVGFFLYGSMAVYQFNMLYNNRNQVITTAEGIAPLMIKLGGLNLGIGLCLKI